MLLIMFVYALETDVCAPSSVSELQNAIVSKLIPLTNEYSLALHAFGRANLTTGEMGMLNLSNAWGSSGLNPAPVTPTEGSEGAAYKLLSGVIRQTRGAKKTVVSPAIGGGNTGDYRYRFEDADSNPLSRHSLLLERDSQYLPVLTHRRRGCIQWYTYN